MTEQLKVETGLPCRIIDGTDLESQGIFKGDVGMINSVVEIPVDEDMTMEEFIYFMPKDEMKSYVISSSRIEVIDEEEAIHLGIMDVAELPETEIEEKSAEH